MTQRADRHDNGIFNGFHQQLHIDKLARKQRQLAVGKTGLGLDGAGGGVDLVVKRCEHTGFQHAGPGTVQRRDRHRGRTSCTSGGSLLKFASLVLRNGKHHINGGHLRDQDDASGVTSVDHIAHVNCTQTDPATDRCNHPGVAKVQSGHAFRRLVNDHRALKLLDQRSLRVHILAGD